MGWYVVEPCVWNADATRPASRVAVAVPRRGVRAVRSAVRPRGHGARAWRPRGRALSATGAAR